MSRRDPETNLCAALPYRLGRHGLEILLISNRETRGWGIPQGTPSEERHPDRTAEIEAFYAAGVKGAIGRRPIGEYPATKRLPTGAAEPCLVDVYPLLVANEAATWPSKNQCRRIWFPANEAADKASDAALGALIRQWQDERITSGRGTAKMARGRGGSRHG